MAERKLTPKQQLFVEAYLGLANGNATEAARLAGFRQPRQQGSRLLSNVDIAEAIAERLQTAKDCMRADEVLARITAQARGSIDDFVGEYGELDLAKARARRAMPLVKSISPTKWGHRLELYSAQTALELLGRYHGLFRDRLEHSIAPSVPDDPWGEVDEALDRIEERTREREAEEAEA